ncbi:hypothetical protein Tsubulata_035935 [Turnera subulata]|uniref:Uncharacterized protein n=1 Tax=Turnera subulata TaxID=218843 RepID=A0A9Q0GM33_9ROSI|nr:hypothetical protein Tsubulata_035935 [Turnera subulata]
MMISPRSFFSNSSNPPEITDATTLISALENECADKLQEKEKFPFKIKQSWDGTVTMSRNFHDEIIEVEVIRVPIVKGVASFYSNLKITKANGKNLKFSIEASADKIEIISLDLDHPNSIRGPKFWDLDRNLQKAFHKYLEIRGSTPGNMKFFFEYVNNKGRGEYLQWLQNLKSIIVK